MNNYRNGKIYMIMTENSNDIYIGSTIQTLKARLNKHESYYKTGIYCSSAEIIKQGNYKIILIKNFACDSKEELEFEETRFQKDMVCVNKILARLTDEEKRQNNKQNKKKYYIENKQRINENKKKYYIENKQRINENKKKYYIENKERLNRKINCDCGGKFTSRHKTEHFKSLKHKKYLKSKTKYIFKIKR